MGFSLRRLLRIRDPSDDGYDVMVDVSEDSIQQLLCDIYLRELAFHACTSLVANALSKCEFRTYKDGEEYFGLEYYAWNYSPNRNQNKYDFLQKLVDKLFADNKVLIVQSDDGQLFIADSFTINSNSLYGNSYSNVRIGNFTYNRTFQYDEVLFLQLNNHNLRTVLNQLYGSYSKLIDYASKSYLKSRGHRGILNISNALAAKDNFQEQLGKMMNDYFKPFFKNSDAVLPLQEGYSYDDLGSKTYSSESTRDIKALHDDVFDFTARAFNISPSLVKGDVADVSKAVDEMLTFCLDPLTVMLKAEINRKKYGEQSARNGTYLTIDTKRVKHVDLFDIATNADKLIGSGVSTINMILRAIDEPQVDDEWANTHFMTKNYSTADDVMSALDEKGGTDE